ncbi:MAG TPA: metal ABC transporter permease [Micromonosporaceae bacterium]|jgi:zinc/manganese transport system permease protein|nr:metal ABC transporter permease [Micromonosporaceae bacterium]
MTPFTWNLIADLREMWSIPLVLNAFRAGTVIGVVAAVVGWFMVLRRQSFAGHTLALVGFPGAAAAVWLGIGVTVGYFSSCIAAALVIALLPAAGRRGYREESAVIGTVQAFALACGTLFVSLYKGFLGGTTALLFGTFVGISARQVVTLAVVGVAVVAVIGLIARPLVFGSIDPDVAAASGIPVRALDAVFLVVLGATAAEASQITGTLLVFALLLLPAATAQRLTARPGWGLVLAVAIGLITVWTALFIAVYSVYPIGFWLTTIAFGLYVLASAGAAIRDRRGSLARASERDDRYDTAPSVLT